MTKLFKILRIASICLHFITGISAAIAGLLFIIDPSGKLMSMSIAYLSNSTFSNYLIPGIILFLVNGVMNMIAAIAGLYNYGYFPMLSILQGLLLSGWIIIQVILVRDFNGLHLTMLLIGIILVITGTLLKGKYKPPVFTQSS